MSYIARRRRGSHPQRKSGARTYLLVGWRASISDTDAGAGLDPRCIDDDDPVETGEYATSAMTVPAADGADSVRGSAPSIAFSLYHRVNALRTPPRQRGRSNDVVGGQQKVD